MCSNESLAIPVSTKKQGNLMALDILLDTAQTIPGVVDAASGVIVQKENFSKYSSFLKRVALILQELAKSEVESSEITKKVCGNLKMEIEAAKKLAFHCSRGNKLYLLLNCKRIVEDLGSSTKNISGATNLLLESLNVASDTNGWLMTLCKDISDIVYQISAEEEVIMQKIEAGIEERIADRSYASNLLTLIFKHIGISSEQSQMKTEFESFKNEMNSIECRAEAWRMEQIMLLLSNADVITSPREKEMKYLIKRNSLGGKLLEPLPSFYCPITADVMVDPVQTSSGQTFERAAIEKWLAEGNNLCPLTNTPLSSLSLRSNRTLLQSIEEWRNRNAMISITAMKPEIQSNDEGEVLCSMKKLSDLCKTSELHRECIVMEDYIPIVIGLLSVKNSELRLHALSILYYLAKDSDNNKERIAAVNESIAYIVRLLARKVEERSLALQLLLELSRSAHVRNHIGIVQGCILLLVTLASSDDAQASQYAHEVLDNLSFLDQNVIQMAKAKFFKPLLHRLYEGPVSMQIAMANTLANLELTDHNRMCLSRDGALRPLLEMLKHGNVEMKTAAVKSLQNLSGIAPNGLHLIKEGAKDPLLELIFCPTPTLPKLRKHVAKTIMHLAMSTTSPEAHAKHISLLETDEEIFKLFSLISYAATDLQEILLLIFHSLCKSPSGPHFMNYLRQISAVKVLIQLCELDELIVRVNAVKLFYYLIQDGDPQTFLEHVNKKCIAILVQITNTSDDEEEIAAAMGIIAHLPDSGDISVYLLEYGALKVILNCLTFKNAYASHEKEVVQNAAAALCRFTVSSNLQWQKRVADAGMIPVLVRLLSSTTPSTKHYISISLKQLSESSSKLSSLVKRGRIFECCFTSSKSTCPVHSGICTIESSFCLLEAGAMKPLVAVLGESDVMACEASLDAILTLIEGVQLQNGCKVLEEANAVLPIIKLLNTSSTNLQEKALGALLRIFRSVELKAKHGKAAQMFLVDITQRGSSKTKPLAARILAQLNVLNDQSNFFDGNA